MERQSLLAIKQNRLLKNIESSELDFSQIRGQLKTLNQGAILYREGFKAESIFLIISGELNVLKKNLYGKSQSIIFSDNDCFGYNEIVDGGMRTSTAVALRDTYLIELSITEVGHLMSQSDKIEKNIRGAEKDISFESKEEEKVDSAIEDFEIPENELDELLNDDVDFEEEVQFQEPFNEDQEEVELQEPSNKLEEDLEEETDDLDGLILEQVGPGEFEIKDPLSDDEDHFHLEEPKDHSEISKLTEADDEIPKEKYSGKNRVSDINSEKPNNNETSQFNEEDEAFFAGLEKDNNSNLSDESLIPSEELENINEPDDDKLKMQDRFTIDDEYPTEIIKEDVFEEEYFEENNETLLEEEKSNISSEEKATANIDLIDTENENLELESKELTSDQLRMINKAAHSVTSNVKIEEVLNNIVEAACELTGADRGTLYLVDKESNELWSKIVTESEVREIRLNIGEGIAGWVAGSGEIVNIANVDNDQRFKRDFDRSSGYKTKNMICFPLKNKENNIIGVIQLLNSKNGSFSNKDEQFLNALSAHASAALINAELVEKLLKSERVTSLGKMANFLIQDIKKPVLVSKRYAEHLISKDVPKDVKQVLEMMLEQLNHVADIVQTTSSYSEGKTLLRTVSTSLNETLDDYINRVDAYLRNKGCSITTQYDIDVNVKVDLKEFFQCFNHLIKNACEAMPDGGSISIITDRKEENVNISFKDSGLGIPDTIIDKIFEPFMSYGKKEGTGLGLSITKKIIENHSGSILVKSDLGEGTTFIVSLPIASSF